jgi:hypothetical protein
MIGFIDTYLQLQSIMTARNQWLTKTRSIPCWTTSVFSSYCDYLVLIYGSVTSSAFVVRWLTVYSGTLNTLTSECRLTRFSLHSRFYSLAITMKNVCCLRVSMGTLLDSIDMGSAFHTKSVSTNPHLYRKA